jgi:hypothetical protein
LNDPKTPYHFLPKTSAEQRQNGGSRGLNRLKLRKTVHLVETSTCGKPQTENLPPQPLTIPILENLRSGGNWVPRAVTRERRSIVATGAIRSGSFGD